MPRIAFVSSHPIQYQVPVFRCLAARDDLDFRVLFAMVPDAAAEGAGFGVEFEWDIPLLEGYPYQLLENVAHAPSVTRFKGCDTPSIRQVLAEARIDAVVVNGWVVKTCLQTLRACKRLRIPCIVRGEANHLRPRPWWKRFLQRRLVRSFDAFLPIGSANRSFYESYGIQSNRMFDAPYCVENSRFERAATLALPQRGKLREQWDISQDAICFLYCGKFEPKKHPVELIDAFFEAYRQDSRLHLLMVGDGELRPRCESLVRSHLSSLAEGTKSPVTFAGFLNQSKIVDSYVSADCLVLPSDHGETWGLVTNEAMACSRPAIVSDQVGCARDLVRDGETGFVFPFGDWTALAKLLVRFASDTSAIERMGKNANRRIQDFSPQRAADGIVQAVRCVVG